MSDTPTIKIIDIDDDRDYREGNVAPPHYSLLTSDFLFGGRAYFRVLNDKNESMLYLIRRRSGRQGTQYSGEYSYFVSVFLSKLQGFAYVGVMNRETGDVVPTGRSKFLKGQREHDVAEWAIKATLNRDAIHPGYQIMHDDRCGACGQALASRGDRETGFHLNCDQLDTQETDDV